MPQAKGSNGLFGLQYESVYKTNPVTPDLTKIYFEKVGIGATQNQIASNTKQGSRLETKPALGNIDASGNVSIELMAYPAMLYYGATGSIATTLLGTGEVVGAALTTPTAVIDPFQQILTISAAAHGVAVGDTVQIAGITAPTALNNLYCRCISVTSAGVFVVRIPMGISGAFTLGAGTIKKVTTPGTSYQHLFKAGGVLPSFVGESGFPDIAQYFLYNGLKIGSWGLDVSPEGFQMMSFDFMGAKETKNTTSFDSTQTDLGKASFNGFQMTTIEEGGAPIAIITKQSYKVDNGLDNSVYTCGGGGTRASLPEGSCKVSGSITALFQDAALIDKAIAGTESSIKNAYTLGTGVGTAGNEYFEIIAPEIMFKRKSPNIDTDKGILVQLDWTAYYENCAQGTSLQMVLKNSQLAV